MSADSDALHDCDGSQCVPDTDAASGAADGVPAHRDAMSADSHALRERGDPVSDQQYSDALPDAADSLSAGRDAVSAGGDAVSATTGDGVPAGRDALSARADSVPAEHARLHQWVAVWAWMPRTRERAKSEE